MTAGKLRILYCSSEPKGTACSVIRVVGPLLRDPGIELRWFDDAPIKELLRWAELVLVQRNFPTSSLRKRRILRHVYMSGLPIFYETDDNLLAIPESNPHYKSHKEGWRFLRRALRKADAFVVSTPELSNELRGDKPCLIFPNLLDELVWTRVEIESDPSPVCIGFAGTQTHVEDLDVCEESLFRIAAKHGDGVRFVFMGCITEKLKTLPNTSFVPFQDSYEKYAGTLRSSGIHIGLAPLRDTAFNRSKSAIKWMEMSACGIAGIFSDLHPYREILKDGDVGILAGPDTASWFGAMDALVMDQRLRIDMARLAQEKLYTQHTLGSQASEALDGLKLLFTEVKAAKSRKLFGRMRRMMSFLKI
jgi:glycosyltransferase involved in cell wall biosynthesis